MAFYQLGHSNRISDKNSGDQTAFCVLRPGHLSPSTYYGHTCDFVSSKSGLLYCHLLPLKDSFTLYRIPGFDSGFVFLLVCFLAL